MRVPDGVVRDVVRRAGADTRVGRLVRVRVILVLVRVVNAIGFRVGVVRVVRTGAVNDLVVRGG